MKIKEIIVVEGRDDVRAINDAVEAECITTSGLGLNDQIAETIQTAAKKQGIIIFTDPDFPGDKIRKMVKALAPEAKEAFLKQEDARHPRTGKFGIEHASAEAIREALRQAKCTQKVDKDPYTLRDMTFYGLSGQPYSSKLRQYLTDHFGIGHANSKQFLKKINAFAVPRQELENKIKEWLDHYENQ